MKKEYVTIPNVITFLRIVGAIILIFLKSMSKPFLIVYTVSGLTDGIDGYLARKLNSETDFGSKLDSVADLSFYTVMMIKIFPLLFERLPVIIWYWVFGILIFRILTYIVNAIKQRQFLSSHTFLNKATGLIIFLIPYWTYTNLLESFCFMTTGIGLVAAIHEFLYSLLKIEKKSR